MATSPEVPANPQRARGAVWTAVAGMDRVALALAVLHGVACAVLAVVSLRGFPNSGDEYNYVWVSQRLLEGRLSLTPPPMPDMVRPFWQFILNGRWVSAYLPSWPALMAPFSALGVPFLANPVVGGVTVYALFSLVRRVYQDRTTGLLAALVLATNPMVLLNGASFFPHPACLMLAVLVLRAGVGPAAVVGHAWAWALTGVLAGFMASIRPQDAVSAFLGPGLLLVAAVALRKVRAASVLWCAGGVLLGLLPLLAHNFWSTGQLTHFVQQVADPAVTKMEFTSQAMKPRIPLLWEYRDLLKTWMYPVDLAALVLLGLLLRPGPRNHKLFDLAMAVTVLPVGFWVLLFPLSPPHYNSYGPRYTYLMALPLAVLFARGATQLLSRRALAVVAGVVLVGVQLRQLAIQEPIYAQRITERTSLARCIDAVKLDNAVVFLATPTGLMLPRDLLRNDPELKNPVVFGSYRSVPEVVASLPVLFPGRTAYFWEYQGPVARGTLKLLGPDGRPAAAYATCVDGAVTSGGPSP